MKVIFVAGTDTGVGKTIVAGAMAAALRLKGHRAGVMKPVACGSLEDSNYLQQHAQVDDPLKLITPIYLKEPLSPNVAARFEKKKIDLKKIDAAFSILKKKYEILIVEGCGGLLVPVLEGPKPFYVVDLILRMKAKCVLVSRSGLGAINHSLLSIEALRARKIEPLGVIYNRLAGGPLGEAERTNPGVISKISKVRSLGTFPYMKMGCEADCTGKAFLKHIDFEKIVC